MSSSFTRYLRAAAASLVITAASGQVLTTINPCPEDPTVTPIVVTAQYQPVSTCFPITTCSANGGTTYCNPTFAYSSYPYVSTVIPCAVSNGVASTCTVTATDEIVVLATATETLTEVFPVPTISGKQGQRPAFTTIYETREGRIEAEYDDLGPLAISGYGGSELCQTCVGPNGFEQEAEVIECRSRSDETTSECRSAIKTWMMMPPPPPTQTTAICSTEFAAPIAGTYTFVFEQQPPPQTVTAPPQTITIFLSNGRPRKHTWPGATYTITKPNPWYATVTRSCNGPTTISFTTTITTTITTTAQTVTVAPTSGITTTTGFMLNPTTTGTTTTTASVSVNPTNISTTSSSVASTSITTSSSNTGLSTTSTTTTTSSNTGISTTSTTTTSSSSASASISGPFVINVQNLTPGPRKRALQGYLGFNGDIAVVGDPGAIQVSQFQITSDGFLYTYDIHQVVGTNATTGAQLVYKFNTAPVDANGNSIGAQDWSRDVNTNRLTLFGPLRFCVDSNNYLEAIFPTGPAVSCIEVQLYAQFSPISTTSTTLSVTSTSTASSSSGTSITQTSAGQGTTTITSTSAGSGSTTSSSSNTATTDTTSATTTSGSGSTSSSKTTTSDATTADPTLRTTSVNTSSSTTTTADISETSTTTTATTSVSTTTTTTTDGGVTTTTTTTGGATIITTSDTTTTTVSPTTTAPPTTTVVTTTTSTTTTGPCATITGSYVLQGSGTGDFAVDGNFAQLQNFFGSGYRTTFNANRQNAQQFKIQPDCSLTTSDGNLLAMVGAQANLHYVYFFPSIQSASALVNVNWEALVCVMNADNTLTCTAMGQSIFQVEQGDPTLEIGDQNYGEVVTINMVPVPGSVFKRWLQRFAR